MKRRDRETLRSYYSATVQRRDCATRPHNATVQREMLILNEKMPHSGAKSVKCVVGTQPSPPSGGTLINHVYPSKSLEKVIVIITA